MLLLPFFVEESLEFFASLVNIVTRLVEFVAILEDESQVFFKLLSPLILVAIQLSLDSRQVHGLLDDLEVSRNVEGDWVDRMHEVLVGSPVLRGSDLLKDFIAEAQLKLILLFSGTCTTKI